MLKLFNRISRIFQGFSQFNLEPYAKSTKNVGLNFHGGIGKIFPTLNISPILVPES